ncbi:MAG: alpha/beta hydrolase [Sphingomonadaceae bacterium]|nr:alpha/beta hydrolase [Sphingomonadaceae bacterium]
MSAPGVDHLRAPLAHLGGAKPPAPPWFDTALADAPERRFVEIEGARIESLSWGERGKPGLLFLHGNGAHADWWSFIAPFFAAEYRVAALSWSGMGASDHRSRYSLDLFIAEAFGVAEAEGLFDSPTKPLFIGHSFGGFPLMGCTARQGDRLRGAVMVDTPVRSPEEESPRRRGRPSSPPRPHRVYPSVEEALGRFRFAPEQPCENLFIADHIARTSLQAVDGGWTWKFDPFLWSGFELGDTRTLLADIRAPFALIWGDRSMLMPADLTGAMRRTMPAGSPAIAIPDAAHHVMVDQPLAFVSALRGLLASWPAAA